MIKKLRRISQTFDKSTDWRIMALSATSGIFMQTDRCFSLFLEFPRHMLLCFALIVGFHFVYYSVEVLYFKNRINARMVGVASTFISLIILLLRIYL
ncbi:hypothetical protein AB6D70_17135 [Vibrio splendidus]